MPCNAAENRELPAKSYVFATQSSQARDAGEWESTQVAVCPEANSSPFIERLTDYVGLASDYRTVPRRLQQPLLAESGRSDFLNISDTTQAEFA